MNNLRKHYHFLILGIIILLGVIWIGRYKILKFYYHQKFSSISIDQEIQKHKDLFLEDRTILANYEIFKPSYGQRDAGPYLNSKIHWEIGDIHHQGTLVLPEFIHRELGKNWTTKRPLFSKMGIKFDWMKELLQYDYWNPEENSPAFPPNKKYLTYSFPIPTYKDLITWAKLRLLYGKEKNDSLNALKEVRHLVRLIWTNDYLVSSIVAVNMLKLEHEIGLPHEPLVPIDVLMRAKRHFYAIPGLVDIRMSDGLFKELTSSDVGVCPMILEGLMSYVSMREMLQNDLSDKYARIDNLIKQHKCRHSIVHKMWEDQTWPTFMSEDQNAFAYVGEQEIFGERLTWKELKANEDLKVILGYVLTTANHPHYFKTYEAQHD